MATQAFTPTYTAVVTAAGGREGHAVSDDGVLDVRLTRPASNAEPKGTNPEQLFAAAWAACFQGALYGAARTAEIDASGSTVEVAVSQGRDSSGAYGLAATITVRIPGLDLDQVQELADAAHQTCPYSKATRGNIPVDVVAGEFLP